MSSQHQGGARLEPAMRPTRATALRPNRVSEAEIFKQDHFNRSPVYPVVGMPSNVDCRDETQAKAYNQTPDANHLAHITPE